jgi:hypothetical protein
MKFSNLYAISSVLLFGSLLVEVMSGLFIPSNIIENVKNLIPVYFIIIDILLQTLGVAIFLLAAARSVTKSNAKSVHTSN